LEFALVSSGILIGLKNGLSGVAIGIVIGSSIFVTIPYWKISGKLIDFHLKEILIELSKPFFCALLMGIVMYFAQFLIQSKIKNNLIVLTILTILGIGFYLTIIHFMKIDSFKEIKLLIKSRIKRRF
jgi:peptidoglycan biosynthesis protein MviN/MurJ (putative lipid II flippase)